jgi:hypothetical protein
VAARFAASTDRRSASIAGVPLDSGYFRVGRVLLVEFFPGDSRLLQLLVRLFFVLLQFHDHCRKSGRLVRPGGTDHAKLIQVLGGRLIEQDLYLSVDLLDFHSQLARAFLEPLLQLLVELRMEQGLQDVFPA